VTPRQVVGLYHDHGTSEQFHSELKTALNLERFPSGKFATNALILLLGMVAYDALRLVEQMSLELVLKRWQLKRSAARPFFNSSMRWTTRSRVGSRPRPRASKWSRRVDTRGFGLRFV